MVHLSLAGRDHGVAMSLFEFTVHQLHPSGYTVKGTKIAE